MADFNFFLNRQGVRGNKGEQGEQGYSPRITVKTETAAEYVLNVQNEDGSFDTPNLRGNAIENLGGTYVRFNQDTEQMYTGYADTASTTSQGEVVLSTYEDLASGGAESEVTTSKDVHDFVEAKISEASVNYVDIDDYTQKMGELDSEISDLDDNKLDFTGLTNTLSAGTNITITPNVQTGKITIAGEPVSQAQADWNQADINAPDYIKNKPVIDDELSSTSTNAVQNRLVTNAINLISNEFENYATNKLDNLSNEGEARLHALKAYSDNGEVLTDSKGLADVIKYAHSSFDLSKFRVVGSPNITDDGIASGFSTSDYISLNNQSINLGSNFELRLPFRLTTKSNQELYRGMNGGTFIFLLSVNSNSVIFNTTDSQSNSLGTPRVIPSSALEVDKDYIFVFRIANQYAEWGYIADGVYTKTGNKTDYLLDLSDRILNNEFIGRGANNAMAGSINLKEFAVYTSGSIALSGNITGTDTYTIDSNTITIPYTKSLTGSKIALASSRQDIVTVATALGSANYYTLDENNGNFTLPQVELYGLIEKAASTVPSGVVQSSTISNIVSLTQAEYDALTTKDSNTFYVIMPST